MSWNYRIIETEFEKYPDEKDYSIHEVYYNKDGSIQSITLNPVPVSGDTQEEVGRILEMMKEALEKPILKKKKLEEQWRKRNEDSK